MENAEGKNLRSLDKMGMAITYNEGTDYLTFCKDNSLILSDIKELKEVSMLNPKYYPFITSIFEIDEDKSMLNIIHSMSKMDNKDPEFSSDKLLAHLSSSIQDAYKLYLGLSEEDKKNNTNLLGFIFARKYFFNNGYIFGYQANREAPLRILDLPAFRQKFVPLNLSNALSLSKLSQGLVYSVNGLIYSSSVHFLSDFFFLLALDVINDLSDKYYAGTVFLEDAESEMIEYNVVSIEGLYFLVCYLTNLFSHLVPNVMNSVSEHSITERYTRFNELIPMCPSIIFANFEHIQKSYNFKHLLSLFSKRKKDKVEVDTSKYESLSKLFYDKEHLNKIIEDVSVQYPVTTYYKLDFPILSYTGEVLLSPDNVVVIRAVVYTNHITFHVRVRNAVPDRMSTEKLIEIEIRRKLTISTIKSLTVFITVLGEEEGAII